MPSSIVTVALLNAVVLAIMGASAYIVIPLLVIATLYELLLVWLATPTNQ